MENYTIWRTYHKDEFIKEYNLQNTEHIKLFGTHKSYSGININYANKVLCELCTLYYVWKNNLYSEYIGFDHYRRQMHTVANLSFNECQVFHKYIDCNRPAKYGFFEYSSEDLYNKTQLIVKNKYGDNSSIYKLMDSGIYFIPWCSFIMHWDNFIKLCNFLFPIIFEVDKLYDGNLDFNKYIKIFGSEFNARSLAYIGERLISNWIEDNFDNDHLKIVNNDI